MTTEKKSEGTAPAVDVAELIKELRTENTSLETREVQIGQMLNALSTERTLNAAKYAANKKLLAKLDPGGPEAKQFQPAQPPTPPPAPPAEGAAAAAGETPPTGE